MKTKLLSAIALFSVFAAPLPAPVAAQTIGAATRISQNAAGEGGNAASSAGNVSPNGSMAVFASQAGNLLPNGEDDSVVDIFVRNYQTGLFFQASIGNDGVTRSDGNSDSPSISPVTPGGFFGLAYRSDATNLVKFPAVFPDSNGIGDIYFTLPLGGITDRVSVGPGPVGADGPSFNPSVTSLSEPNRLIVAYSSDAENLVSGDSSDPTNNRDVFLATITPPSDSSQFNYTSHLSTIRVSRAAGSAAEPNGDSDNPAVSGNGRFVVFESVATNLISGVSPAARQIYLFDTAAATTTLISRSSGGAPGNGQSFGPAISYNGTFITYFTEATNILSDGITTVPNAVQLVRFNTATGAATRVNVNSQGIAGDGTESSGVSAAPSPDGRFVTFADSSANLVAGDQNDAIDVFVKDMLTGSLQRAVGGFAGDEAEFGASDPSIAANSYNSLDGALSFGSLSDNLVANDASRPDVFLLGLSIAKPTLNRGTIVEVPPDLSASGKRITVTMQSYAGADDSAAAAGNGITARARARAAPRVRYSVTLFKQRRNGNFRVVQRALAKRNTFTFKRLPPATYAVSYRSQIRRGDRLRAQTNVSPDQRVKIN